MSAHRPSLVVGFGEYGLLLQARYLSEAASRGGLDWIAERKHPAGRRLRRLAPIWVPDERDTPRFDGAGTAGVSTHDVLRGAHGFEVLEDLLPQIEALPANVSPEALGDRTRLAADWLIQVGLSEQGSVGLDVYCLAAVRTADQLGRVTRLLEPVRRRLAARRELSSQGEGKDLLNFILILDFEGYWEETRAAESLRAAVVALVKDQRHAREHGEVGFGRIYVFDSGRRVSHQPADMRLEEAHLFLDFLLTGNQRDTVPGLYQPAANKLSPLSAVGIRSVELDAHHLRWLAAARFAIEWLPYVLDEHGSDRALEASVEEELEDATASRALPREAEERPAAAARQADTGVGALDPTRDDWADAVETACSAAFELQADHLGRELDEALYGSSRSRLEKFADQLRARVEAALVTGPHEHTLGSVLKTLQEILGRQGDIAVLSETADERPELKDELDATHRKFLGFSERQLVAGRARIWWAMLAVSVALLAMPAAAEGLTELSLTLVGSPLSGLSPALDWLALHTGAVGVVVLATTWLALGHWGQRALARRVARARAFFTDSQRGRLRDRARRLIEQRVRLPLTHEVATAQARSRQVVVRAATLEVGRVVRRLERRRDEIRWLIGQLRDFLQMNGVEAHSGRVRFAGGRSNVARPRIRLETDADLEAFSLPVSESEAASFQVSWRLLEDWKKERSPFLLDPLAFLDWLQERVRARKADADSTLSVERVKQALVNLPTAMLAFHWLGATNLPTEQTLAVLPFEWRTCLRQAVTDEHFEVRQAENADPPSGRIFLLTYVTDVDEDRMVRG
jgi:hypothetical protein